MHNGMHSAYYNVTASRLPKVLLLCDGPFFHWVKLLRFFMFSGIFKVISFIIFHKHEQIKPNDFDFLLCVNKVNTCIFLLLQKLFKFSALALMLMFVQCTHLRFVHWMDEHQHQPACMHRI